MLESIILIGLNGSILGLICGIFWQGLTQKDVKKIMKQLEEERTDKELQLLYFDVQKLSHARDIGDSICWVSALIGLGSILLCKILY